MSQVKPAAARNLPWGLISWICTFQLRSKPLANVSLKSCSGLPFTPGGKNKNIPGIFPAPLLSTWGELALGRRYNTTQEREERGPATKQTT